MRFVCEKSSLLKILVNVSRSVSQRSTIPALEGVRISVRDHLATFEGFNMEFGIKTSLEISESLDGSSVVMAKIFTDIIKKMPDSLISIESTSSNMSIKCLDCNFDIPVIPVEDFPNLPYIEDEQPIMISRDLLSNMIRQTIFAVDSSPSSNSIYSGELWQVKNKILTIVSLDGSRMAIRREPVNIDSDFQIIVPGKSLSEVMRLFSSDDHEVKIYLSERYIFFELENCVFLSRLLEGEFLDYLSAVPTKCSTKVKLNVNDAISSLERVSIVVDDRMQNPVRASFENSNIVKLSCNTSLGKSSDQFESSVEGDSLEISFNDKYFLDALKSCDSDQVILELTTSLSAMKISPLQGDSFTFLVLPVRTKSD